MVANCWGNIAQFETAKLYGGAPTIHVLFRFFSPGVRASLIDSKKRKQWSKNILGSLLAKPSIKMPPNHVVLRKFNNLSDFPSSEL